MDGWGCGRKVKINFSAFGENRQDRKQERRRDSERAEFDDSFVPAIFRNSRVINLPGLLFSRTICICSLDLSILFKLEDNKPTHSSLILLNLSWRQMNDEDAYEV